MDDITKQRNAIKKWTCEFCAAKMEPFGTFPCSSCGKLCCENCMIQKYYYNIWVLNFCKGCKSCYGNGKGEGVCSDVEITDPDLEDQFYKPW